MLLCQMILENILNLPWPTSPTEEEDIKKRWQECTEELYKKDLQDPDNHRQCDHSPRARHPGMWSQVGLRKHHYKQS